MRTLTFLLALLLLASCGTDTAKTSDDSTAAAPAKTAMKYAITPFADAYEYTDANMVAMKYKSGTFNFDVKGDKYKLGQQTPDAPQKMCANSAKGQHIHLIVNNEPYMAKYTPTFDVDLPDGEHFILAFLSRSYHESIKTDQAHQAVKATIANKSITATTPLTQPMLFYSRPKGTYIGAADTKKVMLDFYPINATIGTDYMVKAEINGEVHTLDKWQPYYVEGLPMGENKITLTLVDAEGKKVDTPLNPVTRTFTLKEDIKEAN